MSDAPRISIFTPSNTPPHILELIMVQRQQLLQDAVERVNESALTDHKHHQLFVGPRGCGKTYLATLIVYKVGQDTELLNHLRIAWLNEDETSISLLELLIRIHAALMKRHPDDYTEDQIAPAYEMKPAEALAFMKSRLLESLGQHTLMVVVENLDLIFEGLGKKGQQDLRSFIQENPRFCIVATAQRLTDDLSTRDNPFFGFFQTEHLKPLNVQEAAQLLQNITGLDDSKKDVVQFLATSRGRARVRALHHLSGGNHRIYIVLSQFITGDNVEALVAPFMKMVDELTPYYQERLRSLPPLQRRIVEYLCTCERTVPVKDIAKRLFTTPPTISSQLQDLREKGYADSSQRGRESLYEIREPLMRICVEVKDNQRLGPLRLLVDFLRVWYEDKDLEHRLGLATCSPLGRAYLEAAIKRNQSEGNLRKKWLLHDLREELPRSLSDSHRNQLLMIYAKAPETGAHALEHYSEGRHDEAFEQLGEAILQATPKDKAGLLLCRSALHNTLGQFKEQIDDLSEVILSGDPTPWQTAQAFICRGIAYDTQGNHNKAIDDYNTLLNLPGVTAPDVATGLINRGASFLGQGEKQLASADFTKVLDLNGAPSELVAMALFNRGTVSKQASDTQSAINDYTQIIGFTEVSLEQLSMTLVNRGTVFDDSGETQLAINDFTQAINMSGAPVKQIAMALFNRGFAFGKLGLMERMIDDLTQVIDLAGAPLDYIAWSLVRRGAAFEKLEEKQRAIEDFTQAINLVGISNEPLVRALLDRGFLLDEAGDTQNACEDYTRVICANEVPKEALVVALAKRAIIFLNSGNKQGVIDDCTQIINLPDAPIDMVGNTLYLRALFFLQIEELQKAREDLERLSKADEMPLDNRKDAYAQLACLHWREGRWNNGLSVLAEGMKLGTETDLSYAADTDELLQILFNAGLPSQARCDHVHTLFKLYKDHNILPTLGEGFVSHLGTVYQSAPPFPSTDNLEQWYTAWEGAGAGEDEFKLPLRLLRTGIDFIKTGGKDMGVLLDLTSPERTLIKQALGLAEPED